MSGNLENIAPDNHQCTA